MHARRDMLKHPRHAHCCSATYQPPPCIVPRLLSCHCAMAPPVTLGTRLPGPVCFARKTPLMPSLVQHSPARSAWNSKAAAAPQIGSACLHWRLQHAAAGYGTSRHVAQAASRGYSGSMEGMAGPGLPPSIPPDPSMKAKKGFWTFVDVIAILGSVGGALAAILNLFSGTAVLFLPLVLPVISLVAALQREGLIAEVSGIAPSQRRGVAESGTLSLAGRRRRPHGWPAAPNGRQLAALSIASSRVSRTAVAVLLPARLLPQ